MVEEMTVEQRVEMDVLERLVLYPRTFRNRHGEYLPLMRNVVECPFNKSGYGFDMLALDTVGCNLWVIKISTGKPAAKGLGGYLVQTLEKRDRARGRLQISVEWRLHILEGFLESPDLIKKLAILFRRPDSEDARLLSLLNIKFNDHSYAVIVPEGIPADEDNPTVDFSGSIYTFRPARC